MNKKDEEIQRKLQELESAVLRETTLKEASQPPAVATPDKSLELVTTKNTVAKKSQASTSVSSDLCYFGGIGLILAGLFMLFSHVQVGTGMIGLFGVGGSGAGFGLLLLPLLIGIGWLLYDSKSKIPWVVTAASCAIIFLSVLSNVIMHFPMMSLMGLLVMLFPFAAGGALLLKGVGGPKGIEDKLKGK